MRYINVRFTTLTSCPRRRGAHISPCDAAVAVNGPGVHVGQYSCVWVYTKVKSFPEP